MKSLVPKVRTQLIIAVLMFSIQLVAPMFILADSFALAVLYGALFLIAVAFLLIYAWFDVLEFVRSRSLKALLPSALNLIIAIAIIALSSLLTWIFPEEKIDDGTREHAITVSFSRETMGYATIRDCWAEQATLRYLPESMK